jgi:hypothetical protein
MSDEINDEQLAALEEMSATVAVKGPVLRELIRGYRLRASQSARASEPQWGTCPEPNCIYAEGHTGPHMGHFRPKRRASDPTPDVTALRKCAGCGSALVPTVRGLTCQNAPCSRFAKAVQLPPEDGAFMLADELAMLSADAALGRALREALATVPATYELHVRRWLDANRADDWRVAVHDPALVPERPSDAGDTRNDQTRALASALSPQAGDPTAERR